MVPAGAVPVRPAARSAGPGDAPLVKSCPSSSGVPAATFDLRTRLRLASGSRARQRRPAGRPRGPGPQRAATTREGPGVTETEGGQITRPAGDRDHEIPTHEALGPVAPPPPGPPPPPPPP